MQEDIKCKSCKRPLFYVLEIDRMLHISCEYCGRLAFWVNAPEGGQE